MAASVREGGGATDPAALFPFVELEGSLKDEVGGLNAFLEQTHRDLTVWGIASICASTLLLLAFSCYPRVRRTPGWQFLYSSVCEIFVAGGFVALSLLDDGSSRGENMEHLICHDYSSLMLMILGFDMAANSWRLFMYVDLIVVYHNPFQPNTARPLYHVLVVLLVASWLVAITSSDVLCGAADGSVHVPALTWGLVYGPFLLFVLLGGSLYLAVKALLSKDTASHRISRLARQRVMQHCFFYLVLYGVLLGLLSAGYASYHVLSTPVAPYRTVFAHVTAALTSGRPVFGFVGWCVINALDSRIFPSVTASLTRNASLASAIASTLRQPLLDAATPTPAAAATASYASEAAADSQGVYEAGFKEELRYELVTDVAFAISELAEREASDTFEGSPPLPPPMGAGAMSPMRTPPELLFSSPAASGGGGGGGAPRTPPHLAADGIAASPSRPTRKVASPLGVTHYAVAHFRAIRETFGISAAAFAAAFKHGLEEPDDSARRLLRESVSEGATGSFFYWVKHADGSDTGYIVKQITKREKDALMGILPAYKVHVQSRGGATLLQYLSCHSMKLRWQWSGKVYFVVMRNFFPVRPQLSFDLKGATANRRALKTWELHQANTVAGMYSTLRDWEWMDIGMATDMEEGDKGRVWAMVCADTAFLQGQQLLDYSLLVGIYRPPAGLVPQQKQAALQRLAAQCRGTGVVSRDRQKIYFFGLIDVLERFTIRWRVQRAVLRLLYCLAMRWTSADGISAMPPPLYADRFRTFMAHEVLQMEHSSVREGAVDNGWRGGLWLASLCSLVRRLLGLPMQERAARRGGRERWAPLWERRRRGLVKQRIDSEHEDQTARIKELEERVSVLEYELTCAGGAHPSALSMASAETTRISDSHRSSVGA